MFVHGLSGHIEKTWTSNTSNSQVLWPSWLEEDIPEIGLWLVGYPAAKTNWDGGYGTPFVDRANGILARLLIEPDLSKGNIIFIAHSLGGLVVEQILRNADRDASSNQRAKDFLARVRRVAFLATPHRGTFLASVAEALSPLTRPSEATSDLRLNNPQLRDLNYWYRRYSRDNGIENLILAEGHTAGTIGRVVSVNSADAGVSEIPICVDENHTSISKPATRDAEVYFHVRNFVSRPFVIALEITGTNEAIKKNTEELQRLGVRTEQQIAAIDELKRMISKGTTGLEDHSDIIDAEVQRRAERLRKLRVFGEFDAIEETRRLVTSLEEGELALVSEEQKGTTLAWCARFLSGDDPAEAESILGRTGFSNSEVSRIARSVIKASSGNLHQAISELCAIGTSVAYGAAYINVLRAKGFKEANEWLQKAGLTPADLDSDAKFFFIRKGLEDGSWDIAFNAAEEVGDDDCERSPALFFATADAFLMQAVPEELRTFFLTQILPFDAARFPLRGEPLALEHRRNAIRLYKRLHTVAEELGLPGVAGLMDDKALWLGLVDPESRVEARGNLEKSIRDSTTFLRRLGLGLQFGVDIDLEWAERKVDQQTALSGGMSSDAAFARFALAFSKESHASVAAYINEHRDQLLKHLDWRGVYFIEIEMLASAGQTAKAEERLKEAIERGLSVQEIARLRRELAEATGGDPIAQRLMAYEESGSIMDLRILVAGYEDVQDWKNVCKYGKTLLDVSGDLADVRRYVISLYNINRHDEVLGVMETYPDLWNQDDSLRLLRVQTLFECGRLKEALDTLQILRQSSDSPEARHLQINLAVVSGDWESLQGLVEEEWNARSDRTAIDLLRAGQIAQHIGAGRGKELVQEAANRAPDDPTVLVGCYHAASAAGWEDSIDKVHQWLERAAELSGVDGPVQMIAIEDMLERKPVWEQRESNVWELLEKGDIPVFAVGQLLNHTLLSLYLMPALNNLDEPDVRRRSMIYAFSGARGKSKVEPKVVAMDATALITAEILDLLDVYIETFDNIVIPHSTLGWLLGEKVRILFHQPSRVVAARELRKMITDGHLRSFDGGNVAPERLVKEVGASLAALITDASYSEHQDTRQRIVVRGGPIRKADSLTQEEADLSECESYLCSSIAVVNKLTQKGVLTRREAKDACTALNARELRWPSEPLIADEAVLYLDDLAVSHLQFLGLLSKLHRAGITAFVSRSKVEEADALISYDVKSSDVVSVVEKLRFRLREGLGSGKVRLGTAIRGEDDNGSEHLSSHPTVDLLKLVADADVGVVDDRFINQHASFSLGTTSRPLLTTVDLLDVLVELRAISVGRRQDALTLLRRANFALTPLTAEELNDLIANSTVSDGILEETAELRAIHESIQRVRMSSMMQSPKENTWLEGVTQGCLFSLKGQWKDGLDEATVVARSDWLLALSDMKGWTHRLDDNVEQMMERHRYWVLALMTLLVKQPQSVKEAYWRWFDSRVLGPLQEENPGTYRYIVEWAKKHVAGGVEACEQGLGGGDDYDSVRHTLVEVALDFLPPRLRSALLDDKEFIKQWDLATIEDVTLGKDGPSFRRDQFYKGIRVAIRESGRQVPVKDDKSAEWKITAHDESQGLSFKLKNGEKNFQIAGHSGLAEDYSIRVAWFDRSARKANLEGAVFRKWKARIDSGALGDEEFAELAGELELTPISNFRNLQASISQGSVDIATLVPGERRYYDRLVGSLGSVVDATSYVEGGAAALIARLPEWEPVQGFLLSLLMCSKGSVSEYIRVEKLDGELLIDTYEWLASQGDPISQIGAVELALGNIEAHPQLETFIERMVECFIEDDPEHDGGCFSLLSAMIILVASELTRRHILGNTPPFYRKQAAFAQASLIIRAITASNVDRANVVKWAKEGGFGHIFFLQGLVDLRLEPRWLPEFVGPAQLRAEFIGRVSNAVNQCKGEIQSQSLRRLLIGKGSKLATSVVWPFPMLPGPLEGEIPPRQSEISDDILRDVTATLEAEHLEPNSFAGLVNTALLFNLSASHAELAATALRRVKYSIEIANDENSIIPLIGGLATVAAVTRSSALAEALRVLVRVMRQREQLNAAPDDEMRIAIVAAASYADLEDWARFAGEWITELAFEVAEKETAQRFLPKLRRLVQIEPALARHCAVADAALESFDR